MKRLTALLFPALLLALIVAYVDDAHTAAMARAQAQRANIAAIDKYTRQYFQQPSANLTYK
jgi:hypothetical protein